MGLKNGRTVAGEFAGRLEIADPQTEHPKLRLYQVWGVCPPSCNAMARSCLFTYLGLLGSREGASRRVDTGVAVVSIMAHSLFF